MPKDLTAKHKNNMATLSTESINFKFILLPRLSTRCQQNGAHPQQG